MIDIAMAVVTAALLALFAALLVMAAREDMREEARRRKNNGVVFDADLWVRQSMSESDYAYHKWLAEQDLSTWPYEPWAGYDERREA